jgi:threonine-phosphate decarboxylase
MVPSVTHYFLVKVGNGSSCRSELLNEHIQVRDCFSFDLPEYIRIATKRPEENSRLVAVLQAVKEKRGGLTF